MYVTKTVRHVDQPIPQPHISGPITDLLDLYTSISHLHQSSDSERDLDRKQSHRSGSRHGKMTEVRVTVADEHWSGHVPSYCHVTDHCSSDWLQQTRSGLNVYSNERFSLLEQSKDMSLSYCPLDRWKRSGYNCRDIPSISVGHRKLYWGHCLISEHPNLGRFVCLSWWLYVTW